MSAICGIIGTKDKAAVDAMARAMAGRADLRYRTEGTGFAVAASHPIGKALCLLDGSPFGGDGAELSAAQVHAECTASALPTQLNLRGPFAAVVALDDSHRWWLMRDRLGQRPLFTYQGPNFLLFASELKGLLASGLVPKRLNLAAVDQYLTLRCVPGPDTMLHGVAHVPPGEVIEYSQGKATRHRVWSFNLHSDPMSKESAAGRLCELLEQALARRTAPQLLWSGGIDSATLGALNSNLRPLFVRLDRLWQDEARRARDSARRMGRALAIVPGRRITEDAFHKAIRNLDEPIADPSVLPWWLVLEAASGHGNRFVAGHGADELLGGYARFHFMDKAKGAHRFVPAGLVSDLVPALPPNVFVRRASRSLASIRDPQQSYLSLVSVFDREERQELYTDAMASALHELGEGSPPLRNVFTQPDLTANVMLLDLRVGFPNRLLTKCERLAAAHGITLEHPYLDDALVDFVLRIPADIKFGVRSKPLLRYAMRERLPGPVRLRARRGFRVPQGGHTVRVIENVARQTVTPERVDATGLFRWHTVEGILRSASHNVYRRRQFWALLMFFAWYRNVMET
ncbi:MAG: hypothetical protein IT364_09800 [Candidatus Hydrogenedentes bacterium]|nr:hypothetical protein [Candidatus Hydrogenedentota bacterium]